MRITAASAFLIASSANAAFMPQSQNTRIGVVMRGYLDDLTRELNSAADNPDIEGTKKEVTNQKKEDIDRFGPAKWDKYADFGDEFDGGDGQMGVAGDGKKGLEKFGSDVSPSFAKSKTMSAKNAWGTSTGYASNLIEQGVEVVRAQQMENWMNQQELRRKKNAHRELTESFDSVSTEEDWRALAKFGVQRNQDFDFEKAFGAVVPGSTLEGTIELVSRIGQIRIHEFNLKNEFMGYADFRAAFTSETPGDFTVVPSEGSLSSKEGIDFVVKFKPTNPGAVVGYLVIDTEDMKKTWKVIGSTA